MCIAQGPQGSDTSEAPTRDPLVSSQALYHWATALPMKWLNLNIETIESKYRNDAMK